MSMNMNLSYPFDFQVISGDLIGGYTLCAKCRNPATARLTINGIEKAGRLSLVSFADYCETCIDEAAKQTRVRCHARLYGHDQSVA